jgi:hypothetical protein
MRSAWAPSAQPPAISHRKEHSYPRSIQGQGWGGGCQWVGTVSGWGLSVGAVSGRHPQSVAPGLPGSSGMRGRPTTTAHHDGPPHQAPTDEQELPATLQAAVQQQRGHHEQRQLSWRGHGPSLRGDRLVRDARRRRCSLASQCGGGPHAVAQPGSPAKSKLRQVASGQMDAGSLPPASHCTRGPGPLSPSRCGAPIARLTTFKLRAYLALPSRASPWWQRGAPAPPALPPWACRCSALLQAACGGFRHGGWVHWCVGSGGYRFADW